MRATWYWAAVCAAASMATPLLAGENVVLMNAHGKRLSPSQIESVDYEKSCGDCHDVREKLGANYRHAEQECFTCHFEADRTRFNADGSVQKITNPGRTACISCHPVFVGNSREEPHSKMPCLSCHNDAGHRPAEPPSCAGCHSSSAAPKPAHRGLTSLHLKKIACETCHTARSVHKLDTSLTIIDGMVFPTRGGIVEHHAIAPAANALGASSCSECHSTRSTFFSVWPDISKYTKTELVIGALREQIVKPVAGWMIVICVALSLLHYLIFGPNRVKSVRGEPTVIRFLLYERIVHWLTTLSFAFLAITGTAFLLRWDTPHDNWRILHGQVGLLFTICLIGMICICWKTSRFTSCDVHWLRRFGGYFWMRGSCPAEKFNAGQKLFFWIVVVALGLIICGTGALLIHGKGTAAPWIFTLHDTAAILMIPAVLLHLYLCAFANPGSLNAMVKGYVTHAWIEHHHPDWEPHSGGQP